MEGSWRAAEACHRERLGEAIGEYGGSLSGSRRPRIEGVMERIGDLAPSGSVRVPKESPGVVVVKDATQWQYRPQHFGNTMGQVPRTVTVEWSWLSLGDMLCALWQALGSLGDMLCALWQALGSPGDMLCALWQALGSLGDCELDI